MVAGNHHCADTAPLGIGYRLDGLRPGRVDHGDQADEGVFPLVGKVQTGSARHVPVGEGEDPQPLAGEFLVHRQDLLPPLVREFHHAL